jgi:hypothetical protein
MAAAHSAAAAATPTTATTTVAAAATTTVAAAAAATFHQLKQASRGRVRGSETWRGVCRQGYRCEQS